MGQPLVIDHQQLDTGRIRLEPSFENVTALEVSLGNREFWRSFRVSADPSQKCKGRTLGRGDSPEIDLRLKAHHLQESVVESLKGGRVGAETVDRGTIGLDCRRQCEKAIPPIIVSNILDDTIACRLGFNNSGALRIQSDRRSLDRFEARFADLQPKYESHGPN